ncbi:MAG TPA: hypothetical protein VG917_05055 [Patescibacteria group bacterium]|nr:hypothetical protein [Patescibacteria group bacterium]
MSERGIPLSQDSAHQILAQFNRSRIERLNVDIQVVESRHPELVQDAMAYSIWARDLIGRGVPSVRRALGPYSRANIPDEQKEYLVELSNKYKGATVRRLFEAVVNKFTELNQLANKNKP